MNPVVAQTKHLTVRYAAQRAVDDVSLEVHQGEVLGLLGANGAGKTTLLKTLLGLVPQNTGDTLLFGAPPTRQSRRRVGYVPQGLGLYEDLSAAENLRFSAAVYGRRPAARADLMNDPAPVRALPLGTQRRVAFAAALQHEPDLLLLDEPTSGVDPLERARLWDTIRAAASRGAGVIVTTHHMDEAEQCDRLIIMAEGRVIADGTLADVIGSHEVVIIETPDWARALRRLEAHGLDPSLVGRTLRLGEVPEAVLARALDGVPHRLTQVPASLEERFVSLVRAGAPRSGEGF